MLNTTSNRLQKKIPEIMKLWEERALREVWSAHYQDTLALRNLLPVYLSQLSEALSNTIDRTEARKRHDKEESTRVGKDHGKKRAGALNYTMDQMILEYHILRQVICDVMEEEAILTPIEREVIVCSVEQAVNDAATEFNDTLSDIQEQLSHTLAHDLRNPLTVATASVELILKRPDQMNNCGDKISLISKSLFRIDKMICDLLDASRIRAGQNLGLQFKDCDLDMIAKQVANESNIAPNGRFSVQSSGQCKGNWNEDGLRRLIENLASNAVKYGLENTPITISLIQDENSATISIHNEGTPIPHEEQSILFQQFRRSRSAEKKIGWGLGLTVVKGMVDSHNGSIKVESEEGKGTTFIIRLPKDPSHSSIKPD